MTWFRIQKSEIGQVRSGFFAVGHLFGAVLTFGVLVVGVGLLRFPRTFQTWSWLLEHPYLYGCAALCIASVVLWVTVPQWALFLPWFFGTAALRASISVITAHPYPQPSQPIPRFEAATVAMVTLLIAMFSQSLISRKLRGPDQVAILVLYFGLAWFVASPQGNLDVLVGPVGGISALAIAWLHHKVSIRKARSAGI